MQRYEKYKDSGIDWLGEVPEHWENRKLGNILSPYSVKNRADLPLLSITREKGVIRRGEDTEEDNHNFIPDDLSGYKHLKVGQFGMNKMKAWQGSYGYSNFEGIVSPAYYIFDISSNLFGEYFSKTIRSKAYIPFFIKASDGVRIGQWDLSKQRMKEIPFFVPPLGEQKAITKFLYDKCEKIDGAVILKEQQIEKLKELRQITIHNSVTKGISNFNGEVVTTKDSGIDWIGEIPEGWEVKRLKYTCLINQKSLSETTDKNQELNYVDIGSVSLTNGIEKTESYLFGNSPSRARRIASVNDTIISTVRTYLKAIDFIDEGKSKFIFSTGFAVLTPNGISPKYLSSVVRSNVFTDQVSFASKGMSYPAINSTDLGCLWMPIPPVSEQQAIITHLQEQTSKIDKAIGQRQEQIVKLKEYKQSLINEAVTGKIKIIA